MLQAMLWDSVLASEVGGNPSHLRHRSQAEAVDEVNSEQRLFTVALKRRNSCC